MPKPARPIRNPPPGLRQRWRARTQDWRVWWEPNAPQRAAGMEPVELDGGKPTWSVREAQRLNLQAGTARPTTQGPARKSRPGQNAIDTLAADYVKSPRFMNLAPKTQTEYRKDIARILDRWQGTDIRNLTKPVAVKWYETLYHDHGKWVSKRLIRMLSILLSYAERRGLITLNPIHRMDMITPKGRTRTATWAEFDALDAAALHMDWPGMRLALHLAMFMGQRETDICNARAADFVRHTLTDGSPALHWKLVRSKDTRKERLSYLLVHAEVIAPLSARIDAARGPASLLVTRDPSGKPFTDTSFPATFAKLRDQAAKTCPTVTDLQFRDLRRTFADNARHANIPSDDIDDALGNTAGTDAQLRQVYMPASDDRAARAIMSVRKPA